MAKAGMLVLLLWANLITFALLIDVSQIRVYPKHGTISGVFHASLSGSYAFTASMARDVCEHLGVTIADKAQVARASTHGFETCRFGWIDEQIAVIPRIQVNQACGKGGVGVIVWRARLSEKFDVFCFNATDFEAHAQAATTQVHTTTSGTAAPRTPQSPTAGIPKRVKATSSAPSASWPDLQSTFSGRSRSFNPSLNYPDDTEQALAFSSSKSTIGVVPTALLITTIFTFLLAAIVAVWYFKMSKSSTGMWEGEQQKECIETEVWDNCSGKDVKEVENQDVENADDVSVTMDCENENELDSREEE
ncbi:lymphatic vessel endothelial hyaluronic acid receptor 1a [Salminus brasiliensis]|uniref:lymphatic vessel endothelial hyaluronic acid receptor 1a n=1 Tax=Salminus brasiliensis TaxID=930266 RepID=UPI003B82D5B9